MKWLFQLDSLFDGMFSIDFFNLLCFDRASEDLATVDVVDVIYPLFFYTYPTDPVLFSWIYLAQKLEVF